MITVAGSVIADIFVRTLEREPVRGSLTLVDQVGFHLGGAAPNTGAVLSRLGVPVSVVGRIGSDPFGNRMWMSFVPMAVKRKLSLARKIPLQRRLVFLRMVSGDLLPSNSEKGARTFNPWPAVENMCDRTLFERLTALVREMRSSPAFSQRGIGNSIGVTLELGFSTS